MTVSRLVLAAASVLLLSSSAVLAADPAPMAPTMGAAGGGHGMMRGMFTPDEFMMLMADAHKATASMTDDQKHTYRQQQRARIMGMSDGDRAKFKADLDTRWAALPDAEKTAIKAMVQARMAAHQHPDPQ